MTDAPKTPRKRKPEKRDVLVFVDTNVFLDLYRSRGDSTLRALEDLLKSPERIITTEQVFDEFRRNRLTVMSGSLTALSASLTKVQLPAMVADLREAKAYRKASDAYESKRRAMVSRFEKFLASTSADPAYQLVMRFQKEATSHHLARANESYAAILTAARERMAIGNPPNKPKDPTLGDPINWEWCLKVCDDERKGLVVVSRDGDYGYVRDGKMIPNTFLREEFRSRVSQKQTLTFTDSVRDAAKYLGHGPNAKTIAKEKQEARSIPRAASPEITLPEPSPAATGSSPGA